VTLGLVELSWLQGKGYIVRLVIVGRRFDSSVIEEFIIVLKSRNISADATL
jgi:hypothetical protein